MRATPLQQSSSNTYVALLRHGETVGGTRLRGSLDDPLTAVGLAQMHAALKLSKDWDQIIASPLQRCMVFAEQIAQRYSIPLQLDTRLQELHFGTWEGKTIASLMQQDPHSLRLFWQHPHRYPPPHGEPLMAFQQRVLAAWHNILSQHTNKRCLIVTHAGVIRVLLCHLRKLPLTKLLDLQVAHGELFALTISADGQVIP